MEETKENILKNDEVKEPEQVEQVEQVQQQKDYSATKQANLAANTEEVDKAFSDIKTILSAQSEKLADLENLAKSLVAQTKATAEPAAVENPEKIDVSPSFRPSGNTGITSSFASMQTSLDSILNKR